MAAFSLCACGISSTAAAGESKDSGGAPSIFSVSSKRASSPDPAPRAPAAADRMSGATDTLLQKIADGLPKFDAKVALNDATSPDKPPAPDDAKPVLMEPFTVFDTRLPELGKPHGSQLERILETGSVFRYDGRKLSSELTLLDLATQSNWKPFTIQPPPAASIRLTLSW